MKIIFGQTSLLACSPSQAIKPEFRIALIHDRKTFLYTFTHFFLSIFKLITIVLKPKLRKVGQFSWMTLYSVITLFLPAFYWSHWAVHLIRVPSRRKCEWQQWRKKGHRGSRAPSTPSRAQLVNSKKRATYRSSPSIKFRNGIKLTSWRRHPLVFPPNRFLIFFVVVVVVVVVIVIAIVVVVVVVFATSMFLQSLSVVVVVIVDVVIVVVVVHASFTSLSSWPSLSPSSSWFIYS